MVKARRSKRDSNTPLKNADPELTSSPSAATSSRARRNAWRSLHCTGVHSKVRCAVAVCEVEGGPAYDVELTADAHLIKYELNTIGPTLAGKFDKTRTKRSC